jgi:hypothetical protein
LNAETFNEWNRVQKALAQQAQPSSWIIQTPVGMNAAESALLREQRDLVIEVQKLVADCDALPALERVAAIDRLRSMLQEKAARLSLITRQLKSPLQPQSP